MFKFSDKFNKTNFGVDVKDFTYVKLGDVAAKSSADEIHSVNGMWLHKSKLGDAPVFIDAANKQLVNMPAHMCEVVREILADGEAVQAIKDGKVGYTIYTYESHGKTCYGVNFVDK